MGLIATLSRSLLDMFESVSFLMFGIVYVTSFQIFLTIIDL